MSCDQLAETLDLQELSAVVRYVARLADELERELGDNSIDNH